MSNDTALAEPTVNSVLVDRPSLAGRAGPPPVQLGLSEEDLVHQQEQKRERVIELLRRWRDPDEEEARDQIETWEFLKKALDEDRPSYRKLFPDG